MLYLAQGSSQAGWWLGGSSVWDWWLCRCALQLPAPQLGVVISQATEGFVCSELPPRNFVAPSRTSPSPWIVRIAMTGAVWLILCLFS